MNTENDYLWDKSGEPDPEIQQLEEILGTLRYQSRPLEIPADLQVVRERKFFRGFVPGLAIAATIAMIFLGLGLWVGLQRMQRAQPEVVKTPTKPAGSDHPNLSGAPSPNQDQDGNVAGATDANQKTTKPSRRYRVNPTLVAVNKIRPRGPVHLQLVKDSQVALNEQREAEAGKDQLMLALRVACAKLNFAQKKTQESTNPRDQIHNQHRIG
jgi:hypothetical protein